MNQYLVSRYAHTLSEAQRLMEGVACEQCAEMAGTSKNPAWIIGHLAVAGDLMGSLVGNEMKYAHWHELYAPGKQPSPDRSLYPKKAELMDVLAERHAALTPRIERMTEAEFKAELPMEAYRSFFPTVGDAAIYMMAAHEMYHLGQLSIWRNAAGIK